MSDRVAAQVGLVLVAVCAVGLVVFEILLAVDYFQDHQWQGWLLAALAVGSGLLFAWLAYDVLRVDNLPAADGTVKE